MVNRRGPKFVGVVDEEYGGHEFHGLGVVREGQIHDLEWDGVLITALDVESAENRLCNLGVERDVVWTLA